MSAPPSALAEAFAPGNRRDPNAPDVTPQWIAHILALIIHAEQAARQEGISLRLRSGGPQVRRLFELTAVLGRFTFEE